MPDREFVALEEDFAYQVDYVWHLIETHQPERACDLLTATAERFTPHLPRFSAHTRYRFLLTRATALLRLGQPVAAQADLEAALPFALALPQGAEDVARVYNALGAAHCLQDHPDLALKQHFAGWQAIRERVVKDPNLRLLILSNLANDYLALNDPDHAIGMYEEARKLLQDTANPERKAGIAWGLSAAYLVKNDWEQAIRYGAQALQELQRAGDKLGAAKVAVNVAEIHVLQARYEKAEALLGQARELLTATGDPLLLSNLLEHYADLERRRNAIPRAAGYARQSLDLARAALAEPGQGPDRAHVARTLARVLCTAGLIEEAQGQHQAADVLFEEAIALSGQTASRETSADIQAAYGEILCERGAHERGVGHLRAAWQLYERQPIH